MIAVNGKDVYLDPGQKMCPFGLLHWKHTYASGLRLSDNGPAMGNTPGGVYTASGVQRFADLNIDGSGGVKGTARFILTGQEALHWRQLAIRNDESEVKKQFNESIRSYMPDGVQADFNHFLGLSDYDSNLIAMVNVSGNMGTATGKHFFLPGLFFEAHARHPFVAQDKRTILIDVHYPEWRGRPGHVPSACGVCGRDATPARGPSRGLTTPYSRSTPRSADNDVVVSRTAAFNFSILPATDYGDLHDFYQKVATADQQQLVLTRAQVAKGN